MGDTATRSELTTSSPAPLVARLVTALARLPRTLAAVALALASLVLLARSLRPVELVSELPGFAEAVSHVSGRLGPGQFVVVSPPEQAPALGTLPAAWPAADGVPIEPAAARRYPEIVVLAPASTAPPAGLRGATQVEAQSFGAVVVRRFRYPGTRLVALDLRRDLDTATVRLDGDPPLACDTWLRDGGFGCLGQPAWNRVAPADLRVNGRPWPCVWAHPRAGRPLVIDLGERRLGEVIELEAALADGAAGAGGAAVTVLLEVEGLLARALVRTDAAGVARLELPTARGERRRVRLVVSTRDDSRRHLGLNLRFISGGGDSP